MKKLNISKELRDEILKKKNVVGMSATYKKKKSNGKVKRTNSIRIYVTKKEPLEHLDAKDIVPPVLVLSKKEVPTDIIEIGVIKALSKHCDPAQPGCSSIHKDSTACTTNVKFKDLDKPKEDLVASNNHCYALTNKANIGDPILCPSPMDGGKYPEDMIGKLKKFVLIDFNEFTCPYRNSVNRFLRWLASDTAHPLANKVDIAFRTQIDWEKWNDGVKSIGTIKGKTVPKEGDLAQKHGRTTGHTKDGKVIDLDWVGSVGYSRGTALFQDCILIEKSGFSAGGDSGSPVFVGDNLYIGALFAGSDTHTIVCKIKNIEEEARVLLDVEWK